MILIKFAFWVVIALILCCFTCACISTPVQNNKTPGPSIIDKTPRGGPEKATFETAWNDLPWYYSTETLNLTGMMIYQIHGSGIDSSGNASSWILGIQQGNVSSLLVFENKEWRRVAWGEPFTSPVIDMASILLPTELYDKNQRQIMEAMATQDANESELDLSSGEYTISIRSSTNISILRFDAITGESLL